MAKELFNLVVNTPDGNSAYYQLNCNRVKIGRGSENHIIVIEDPVSTKHCELRKVEGQFQVVDLESKNGTHLNGSPVSDEPSSLKNGDTILLGRTVKIQFVRVREINGTMPVKESESATVTRKLKKAPKPAPTPAINPVAAAVARASRGLPSDD